jgi:glutathione peroxidase
MKARALLVPVTSFAASLVASLVVSLVAGLALPAGAARAQSTTTSPATAPTTVPTTAHGFAFTSITGAPLPLDSFEGRAILVVNTASRCGYTPQYADLQAVWERYRERGLVVLGVPSNDFGGQEPGSEAEIKQFCEVNFDVDFPMTAKVKVRGEDAHPFYRWAAADLGADAAPRWNFHKYLVAPDGRLVAWFPTPTSPTSAEVTRAIESHLPEPAASGS